jgi:type IV pilus assembly protein PilO
MQLSLDRVPWYWQIGAFALLCGGALFGFYSFYVASVQEDLALRGARLSTLRADVARATTIARRLPEFESQVAQLESRLDGLRAVLPESKDVADILRRIQGLAAQSNLAIQRFTPQAAVPQPLYAEVPFKLQAEGTYHDLGAFFDRISKFPRIINISNIKIKATSRPGSDVTIVAECTATTFVLQDAPVKGPAQPAVAK